MSHREGAGTQPGAASGHCLSSDLLPVFPKSRLWALLPVAHQGLMEEAQGVISDCSWGSDCSCSATFTSPAALPYLSTPAAAAGVLVKEQTLWQLPRKPGEAACFGMWLL